jgi:hypothetical protein
LTIFTFSAICIGMKVRFLRSVLVDVEKTRLNEVWDHLYSKWDEVKVESISVVGKFATIKTYDGDYLTNVPIGSFEEVKAKEKAVL